MIHCLDECTFVLLGATGDLSRRKLLPAIYKLVADQRLCKFAIVGVSLEQRQAQDVLNNARQFITNIDEKIWNQISDSFYYHQMDFYDVKAYGELKKILDDVENSRELSGNRIVYLATMPDHFAVITKNFAKYGIVNKSNGEIGTSWSRVVYEKPFGFDLRSAKKINSEIARAFGENQVFRIDHYLGKELVGNISIVRFANRLFEPLWSKKHIESVQIILNENIGVEGRGAFFDSYGIIKDVVQNHALQILALITMEAPELLIAEKIRDCKANVLKKVRPEKILLGQYEGYLEENNVKPGSKTETFAALKFSINNSRWRGVPFYVKAGKFLNAKNSSIHIKFKKADCLMRICPLPANYLTINIHPNEGFFMELNVKIPETQDVVMPVKMHFSHVSEFGPNTPEAYEVLLLDVMKGDHSAFVRYDEINISWKIIDRVEKIKSNLYTYTKSSSGPKELSDWSEEEKLEWRV